MDKQKYICLLQSCETSIISNFSKVNIQIEDFKEVIETDYRKEKSETSKSIRNYSLSGLIAGAGIFGLGLILGKSAATVSGIILSVVSAGGIFYANAKKPYSEIQKLGKTTEIDFQKLNNVIYSNFSTLVRNSEDDWNDALQTNRLSLNSEILSSDIDEKIKSELLAKASSEVSLTFPISEFTTKLRKFTSSEDLDSIMRLVESFKTNCISLVKEAYQKQIQIYSNF